MRPSAAGIALACLAALSMAGCQALDPFQSKGRRGAYRHTAPIADIRDTGRAKSDAYLLAQTAQSRLLGGEAEAALDFAQRAIRLDGRSAHAHSLAGLALDALGRHRDAGSYHRRAADLSPGEGALLNNYGGWLCANGQPAEAQAWFDRAVAAPGYATPDAALANAGACALKAGDLDRASAYLRRALDVAPRNPLALRTLAEVELRRGRAFEARAFIERRLAAGPADEASLLLASQIEQELGDTAAAARYVQRIRAEFPRTSDSAREGGNR